jgi:hypothetical protein
MARSMGSQRAWSAGGSLAIPVELLESKHPFQKGDIVHLSPAEFLMQDNDPLDFSLRMEHTRASTRQ